MVYTADGLFKIPETYVAIDLRDYILDDDAGNRNARLEFRGEGGFSNRRLLHGAFRGDAFLRFLANSEQDVAKRVFHGGVVVLKNDVSMKDADFEAGGMEQWKDFPRDMPEQSEVLWCVRMRVDPCSSGFEENFGDGFLFPVAQTHSLNEAMAAFGSRLVSNVTETDMYPTYRCLLQGPLKQTTSTFDPVLWPLNMKVDKLSYTEAVFAMSLRPAPCIRGVPIQSEPPVELDLYYSDACGTRRLDRPLSTVASLDYGRDCFARMEVSPWRGCGAPSSLPTLPDDVLERIFSMATTRGLAGNTFYDWKMYRALRCVSKELYRSVDKASCDIIHQLLRGIAPMTSPGRHIEWERVREMRDIALNANLHPIEVIMHGSRLDHLTIARIRDCCGLVKW